MGKSVQSLIMRGTVLFLSLVSFSISQGRIVEPSKALERLFDKDDDNCNINDYDGPQECHCGNGRKISTFSSPDFDIYKRDRLYDLACTPIDGYDDVHSGHSWIFWESDNTAMDEYFDTWAMFKDATAGTWTDQNGKSIDESDQQSNLANYFLIGMTSYHEDQTEDRSFKFFYAYSPHYELQNCEWEEYTTYENAFEFEFGEGKVINSINSRHGGESAGEDRKWKFKSCDLVYIGGDDEVELYSSTDDNCPTNEYDKQQHCYCGRGKKISKLTSVHDNAKEDRTYDFTCSDIWEYDDEVMGDSWIFFKTDATPWDDPFEAFAMYKAKEGTWEDINGNSVDENDRPSTLNDFILIGMTSYHKDFYEDRKFRFFYAYSPHYALSNCIWMGYSTYDEEIKFPQDDNANHDNWGNEKAISSLKSTHDGSTEDRKWNFEYCDIMRSCGQIETTASSDRTAMNLTASNRLFDESYDNCFENSLEGQQECFCGGGRKISMVESTHNNDKEDRKWKLTCTGIENNIGGFSGDNWKFFETDEVGHGENINTWYIKNNDEGIYQDQNGFCFDDHDNKLDNYFLIGMTSQFFPYDSYYYDGSFWSGDDLSDAGISKSNALKGVGDRKFKFYYASNPHLSLENCVWTGYFDVDGEILLPSELLSLTWGNEKVISSIKSEFHTGPKDRGWAFEYCDLVPKCGVFESLVFGEPKETDQADTQLKAKIINNLEMNSPLYTTVEISEVDTSSISSAYSFGSTSNTEIGTELEMSATATMGFDDNNNVAITAGVTAWASRNWEKTWTRDGSESYGETRTSSMSWSITCTARCYCERDILVAKKTYSIPYTLTASTLNNPDQTCVEEGELYIENVSEAEISGGDYQDLEKTVLCELP